MGVDVLKQTDNIGLYLEDDASAKFKEWREKMNGLTNSNMVLIDEELFKRALKSVYVAAILKTNDWTWNGATYEQTLKIEGITAETNGIIGVGHSLTAEQFDAVCMGELITGEQTDGALTILANGDKPYCDIPVIIILLG